MNILHIAVADKIATYQKRDGNLVCGNSDYQIHFAFDREWNSYAVKTARFIWNGQYFDVDFEGYFCNVPIIQNATELEVGVFAGDLCTTTSAVIGCQKSILCHEVQPSVDNDKHYANEAKEAAERAEESANDATNGAVSFRIATIEENLGLAEPFVSFEAVGNGDTAIPDGVKHCAFVEKIYGKMCSDDCTAPDMYYQHHHYNPPKQITLDNGVTITIPTNLEQFGASDLDYIYFEGGKAYYRCGTRWGEYDNPTLEEGEYVIDSVNDDGSLIALAEPIITDISDRFAFDGFIDMTGATNITVTSVYNSKDELLAGIEYADDSDVDCFYDVGGVKFKVEKDKVYTDTNATKMGDIDKALDAILAIQNNLIGGDAV